MREILFRGKRTMNDEWVEGYYSKYSYELGQGDFICDADFDYTVYPDSVGQFTGLTDKNGKRIFEGDIVKLFLIDGIEKGAIRFDNEMCRFMFCNASGHYGFDDTCYFKIIGNIHDNPELLK